MKFHLHPGSGFNLSRSLADIIFFFFYVYPRDVGIGTRIFVRGKCNEGKFNQAGTIVDIGKHIRCFFESFFFFFVRDNLYPFLLRSISLNEGGSMK